MEIKIMHYPSEIVTTPKKGVVVNLKNNGVFLRSEGKEQGWLQELINRDPEGVTQGMTVLYNHAAKNPFAIWICPCGPIEKVCRAAELRDAVLNINLLGGE